MKKKSHNQEKIVVGIDASRNRSGGARGHLIGVLNEVMPEQYGIGCIHVWAYKKLLDALPDQPWLIKHNPHALEKSLIYQVLWQVFSFPRAANNAGCEIVLNADAGSVSSFFPSVTMSRDLLSYEPGIIKMYGVSRARLRLVLLRFIQNSSLRRAEGAVFLTQYASKTIQQSCGRVKNEAIIPHGVEEAFKQISINLDVRKPRRLIYVSNAALYKYQWTVIRAVELLRQKGHDLELTLIGGGHGKAQDLVESQINRSDPDKTWLEQKSFVAHAELPGYLEQADIFVFASACEAFGITLLEGMAAGLPIACSQRSCLPELVEDACVYFDPEKAESIASAIEKLLEDNTLRKQVANKARKLSDRYSWCRSADELFKFIVDVYRSVEGE